jgi:hypothetical protein
MERRVRFSALYQARPVQATLFPARARIHRLLGVMVSSTPSEGAQKGVRLILWMLREESLSMGIFSLNCHQINYSLQGMIGLTLLDTHAIGYQGALLVKKCSIHSAQLVFVSLRICDCLSNSRIHSERAGSYPLRSLGDSIYRY